MVAALCFAAGGLHAAQQIADHTHVDEHGGGLDRSGCHNEYLNGISIGYHCH